MVDLVRFLKSDLINFYKAGEVLFYTSPVFRWILIIVIVVAYGNAVIKIIKHIKACKEEV